MIQHILFDFDGTIVDSMELSLQILNDMADKHRYQKVTMEDARRLKHIPVAERFRQIGLPLYKIPAMTMECAARYKREIPSLRPVEGIRETVSALKEEGFVLSILSSNAVDNITEFMEKNRMEWFGHIHSSNNLFGKDKSIRKYLSQFGLKTDEIIYIGDELRDIEACKRVGIKIIAVTWGFDPPALLLSGSPDYMADKPEDIIRIVKSI